MSEIKQKPLGLAGGLAKSFIQSPLSILLFLVMLGAGLMGLSSTARQEDPQISVPMIDIFVQYPGASSQEISNIIIKPLERLMDQILGVKHIYSVSDNSQGIITIEFDVGEKMNSAIVRVRDKLNSNLELMPKGALRPLIKPKEIDDVPIINLTLWSKEVDDGKLRSLSLEILQQLETVKNTNNGFIVGGRKEVFHIDVMPEKLFGYGISLDQIVNTIRSANIKEKTGDIEINGENIQVYSGDFLKNINDIKNLVISSSKDNIVYVRDVANVYYGPEETKQIVSYYTGKHSNVVNKAYGEQAVTIAVAKKFGTNGVEVAKDILKKVDSLKGYLIPDNVFVEVTRNYGKTAQHKVNTLMLKLMIATLAVTFLVWFSLGLRPAIVVTLVIPVVLLMTIFSAWLMNMTIDRVSLFALIFAIGILVDDAIVVVENIYRRWLLEHKMTVSIAVDAVREVGNPTILATFTVVAALVPMAAVGGMMGPYMSPIPILGSIAMMFSLFAAFVFTPYFLIKIKPSLEELDKMHKKEEKESKLLFAFFSKNLIELFTTVKGKYFLISLIVLFFFSIGMFWTNSVVVKMLPLDNKSEFSILIDMPDGTALPNTTSLLDKVAKKISNIPEVKDLQLYSGTAKPFDFNGLVRHYYLRNNSSEGEVNVQLIDANKRSRTSHKIALEARRIISEIAKKEGAKVTIVEMPPGPPVLRPVVAEVYGDNQKIRQKLARDLTEIFKDSNSMADVDNLMRDIYPIWHFEVDSEKAYHYGISVKKIKQTMAMVMSPYVISTIRQKNALEPTNINIKIPLKIRSQLNYLKQLPIASSNGSLVPLSELGKFVLRKQDDLIYNKDLFPVEYVIGEPIGRLSAPIYAMSKVDELLEKYQTLDGKKLSGAYFGRDNSLRAPNFIWSGEWTITFETFRDMGAAFIIALIAIYMLVVWQFGNFLIPAIIMSPIPLTLLGIIPGHWLLSAEFTATSMIGWIALAGIIVRNSILLVDFTVQEYANGIDSKTATINACATRTRPILITAFALVGGSSVILFDPIFQGMAISLLFGVLVSTILTLFVVPLGLLSAGDKVLHSMAIHLGCLEKNSVFKASQKEEKKEEVEFNITQAKNWVNKIILKDKSKLNIKDLLKKEDK
ncbi:Acriflavin resistance protein [hydrothermal vent metagenome]|uniref:Acriflavin resistance protein n=1 Tax=hydrothermal vent metagenome TaxID=652676 RepID=A0A1W1BVN8_9ZZZZ